MPAPVVKAAAAAVQRAPWLCPRPPYGGAARGPLLAVRTIGAREALQRAARVAPPLGNISRDSLPLVELRNGVLHAGMSAPPVGDDVLAAFLRALVELLRGMGEDADAFFGDFADSAKHSLEERAAVANVRATAAVAAARQHFAERFADLDGGAGAAGIRAIEASLSRTRYDEANTTCPACGTQTLVSGSHDMHWEADFDEDGYAGSYPVVTFFPGAPLPRAFVTVQAYHHLPLALSEALCCRKRSASKHVRYLSVRRSRGAGRSRRFYARHRWAKGWCPGRPSGLVARQGLSRGRVLSECP
jgi:hypothetical protein